MNPPNPEDNKNHDEWSDEAIKDAFKQAAKIDEFLFGDYDYEKE